MKWIFLLLDEQDRMTYANALEKAKPGTALSSKKQMEEAILLLKMRQNQIRILIKRAQSTVMRWIGDPVSPCRVVTGVRRRENQ